MAQAQVLRTLTVEGKGVTSINAHIAIIHLQILVQGNSIQETQSKIANRSNALVNLLKSRGVDQLKTKGVSLNPNYRYRKGKNVPVGYEAKTSVSFRVKTDQAGIIMAEAIKAGANQVEDIWLVATDEEIKSAQKATIREATLDAQGKAQAALEPLGFSIKEVVGIQVDGASAPPVLLTVPEGAGILSGQRATSYEDETPSVQIVSGEQEIKSSVTLQITY